MQKLFCGWQKMAARTRYYNFTVQGNNSLLKAAGRQRKTADCGQNQTDHVVELQLVVAALNTLPSTTYTLEGWQRQLVDFFNESRNLQCMERSRNLEKGQAVRKLIQGNVLTEQDKKWIRSIREHWSGIKDHLLNFNEFKAALDRALA